MTNKNYPLIQKAESLLRDLDDKRLSNLKLKQDVIKNKLTFLPAWLQSAIASVVVSRQHYSITTDSVVRVRYGTFTYNNDENSTRRILNDIRKKVRNNQEVDVLEVANLEYHLNRLEQGIHSVNQTPKCVSSLR